MHNIDNKWIWIAFSIFLITALCVDTFVLHRKPKRPQELLRAATIWTSIWVTSAFIFNGLLWFYLYETTTLAIANQKALEFLAGYLIEESLSIDNLFAFYMVFHQFRIPQIYQQRVFSIGIWSAIVLRLLLILFGVWLINKFHWILYVMGLFLLLTGIKMFFAKEQAKDLADNILFKLLKRFVRVTSEIKSQEFFIVKNKMIYATPLFVALIFIEFSDIVFALDSIPAIFAITQDPFIVWSSNIFAILGLRALYFLLAGMVNKFYLLKYGIALLLIFVGTKMLISPWLHIPVLVSLLFIVLTLATFITLSILMSKKKRKLTS